MPHDVTPEELQEAVRKVIVQVPGFPQDNITFTDISPLLDEPSLFRNVCQAMWRRHAEDPPDVVLAVESWGYVFGAPVAYELGSRLALARRANKLPRPTLGVDYDMGYALGLRLEIHEDAIHAGDRVLVVDDVLATGGTAKAALELVQKAGGDAIALSVVVTLTRLKKVQERFLTGLDVSIHTVARI